VSYSLFDDQILGHPKFAKLSDVGFCLWAKSIIHSNTYWTDGIIPLETVRTLTKARDWMAVAQELVKQELYDVLPNGDFRVHDFLDVNASKEKRLQLKKAASDRKERWKNAHGTRSVSVPTASQERSRNAAATRPSPSPSPSPLPLQESSGNSQKPSLPEPARTDGGGGLGAAVREALPEHRMLREMTPGEVEMLALDRRCHPDWVAEALDYANGNLLSQSIAAGGGGEPLSRDKTTAALTASFRGARTRAERSPGPRRAEPTAPDGDRAAPYHQAFADMGKQLVDGKLVDLPRLKAVK
jgi:hypothetical protein